MKYITGFNFKIILIRIGNATVVGCLHFWLRRLAGIFQFQSTSTRTYIINLFTLFPVQIQTITPMFTKNLLTSDYHLCSHTLSNHIKTLFLFFFPLPFSSASLITQPLRHYHSCFHQITLCRTQVPGQQDAYQPPGQLCKRSRHTQGVRVDLHT